jgi:hypothetical protein
MSEQRVDYSSDSHRLFKNIHSRQLPSNFYALDIDLAFVEKNHHDGQRDPHITAVTDFKLPSDEIKFTQALAFSRLVSRGIPVYIIRSQSDNFVSQMRSEHRFDIYRFDGGDYRPHPPECETTLVERSANWLELQEWEDKLRTERRKAVRDTDNGVVR